MKVKKTRASRKKTSNQVAKSNENYFLKLEADGLEALQRPPVNLAPQEAEEAAKLMARIAREVWSAPQ